MSGITKYDLLLNELTTLEKQCHTYVQKYQALLHNYQELQNKVQVLEKENTELKGKLNSGNSNLFGLDELHPEEKEHIKLRINELIDKLDYHLRS